VLAADLTTSRFVGKPNAFCSHAWLYRFRNVAEALRGFAEVQDLPWASLLSLSACFHRHVLNHSYYRVCL
jgi:hypothetical protein